MALAQDVVHFLREEALRRFLKYVQVHTTSDEDSGKHPSSQRQLERAKLLKGELVELGLQEVEVDEFSYVYARLPASPGAGQTPVSFLAHLDTSPAVSGEGVKPLLREKYDGGPLRFPDDPELVVDPKDCPELKAHVGDTLITASGKTLLGADDKAGIAEIMAGLAALKRYPQLQHPELRICFTPDEEIGEGTAQIRLEKLGKVGYTFDGSIQGELEDECFDACSAKLKFTGLSVHPGMAKNKMINAAAIAARFVSLLPEWATPEHTEKREGFFHLTRMSGNESEADLQFIVRDFERSKNGEKVVLLERLRDFLLARYPGLKIQLDVKEQYHNMKEALDTRPEVVEMARKAIEMAGIPLHRNAIRGGTDGAKLSFMGLPTPNLFAGGVLFHSKKEWIGVSSLQKAGEVFVHLCHLWAEQR
ncbi:MAG: peptidase T [Deltaproteobacteria bacterium]|nr:peptidase T [Deltaproteobacteria bacterium]